MQFLFTVSWEKRGSSRSHSLESMVLLHLLESMVTPLAVKQTVKVRAGDSMLGGTLVHWTKASWSTYLVTTKEPRSRVRV